MHCVLCASAQVRVVSRILAQRLVAGWRKQYSIDVSKEFVAHRQVELYECQNCQLQFFPPDLAGSDELYAQLQLFDWYYMPRKWEHDIAIQDMHKGDRVLEVGCGTGDFVGRLLAEEQVNALGIELTQTAVNSARKFGRPVFLKDVKDIALEQAGKFDVVCSFQVLEHIPDPTRFIGACIELLKPGGRLLISVPNSDGFIRLARNDVLNQPPHHVTRWFTQVFESLPRFFPLKLLKILYEPLAPYHLNWYVDLQLGRLPHTPFVTKVINEFVRKLIAPIAWRAKLNQFLRGHTIYTAYEKL